MELLVRAVLFFGVLSIVGGGFLAAACLVRAIINYRGGNAK